VVDAERVGVQVQRDVLPRVAAFEELERGETRLGCVTELLPRTALIEILRRPIREKPTPPSPIRLLNWPLARVTERSRHGS
jgi:hypothetical protein